MLYIIIEKVSARLNDARPAIVTPITKGEKHGKRKNFQDRQKACQYIHPRHRHEGYRERRNELLSNYDGEEPYMPGGYDTPYDGEEPWLPNEYADDYDDEAYDDAYDDGYGDDDYGDDGYYDGPSRYDDDYGYDDAYGYDDDYPPEDGDYDRPPYRDRPRQNPPQGGLMGYLDDNDWPTWLLLLLLPPVGIWLLWRRRRYSDGVNVALSGLSLLWLAAVIYVLVARPFRPASDTTITPQLVGVSATPTAAPVEEEPAEEALAEVVPTEAVDDLNAVFTVEGGPYYHQEQDCTAIGEGLEPTRVSRNSAIESGLMACPYCLAGQYSDGAWDLVFVDETTDDRSNMRVYCSPYNSFFHTDASCSDIGGSAFEVSLKDALLMAKTACNTCCPNAGREVYCTLDGNYYHVEDECSGMRNASHVTYAEARVTGKKRCPVCIGGVDETETAADAAAVEQASGYYVYATSNGTYYHVNSTCSGMQNAQQVLLADMLKQGRPACPKCCPNAESTVFAEPGNPYYHSYATCSGMTNATQGILVNALAAGLTRCPECWTSDGAAATGDA